MTTRTIGALAAAIGGAIGVAAGVVAGGARGETKVAAVSAPLSSAEATELRQDMRELRTAVVNLTDRLSKLEGRTEAKQ